MKEGEAGRRKIETDYIKSREDEADEDVDELKKTAGQKERSNRDRDDTDRHDAVKGNETRTETEREKS